MAVARTPSPPKPAPLARTRFSPAAAAADAVICLCLASLWLTYLAAAASNIGRLVCGEGCRVVAAATEVRRVAFLCFAFHCPVAVLIFIVREAASCAKTEKAMPAPAPSPKSIGAVLRETLRNRLVIGVFASVPFMVLTFLGDMAMESSPAGKGCLISAVGDLGVNVMFCLLVFPTMTRMMCRTMKCIR